jgi:hypothetical protein
MSVTVAGRSVSIDTTPVTKIGSVYLLVAQDQVRVDHFTRQGEGWFLRAFTSLADTLHLYSLGAVLPRAAIYVFVEFTFAGAPWL